MFVIYTDKTPSGHGTDGYVLTFTRHQFDRVGNFQDYFWVAYPSGNEWNYLVSNIYAQLRRMCYLFEVGISKVVKEVMLD